jgi:Calcineurin-like phosphoesterase
MRSRRVAERYSRRRRAVTPAVPPGREPRMRALAVSDLHFGAWTGDPVLARDFALRRLEPELEDIDELVLLGDVFDFLFSTVELAFAQAEPFFELLARTLRGKRLTFLAGNHDHHIALRTLRAAVELKVATGAEGEELERAFAGEYLSFFQRFMDRRLAGVDCRIVYPTHRIGDVLLTHGHYLDAHREGSLPNRLLARATLAVGGVRGEEELRVEDYEAAIVPLTELLFTVAQLPRGCTVQRSFERQFGRIARVLRLGALAEAGARRLAGRRNGQRPGRRHTAGAPATPRSPRRPRSPPSERSRANSAGMGGRRRSSSPTPTSRLRGPPPPRARERASGTPARGYTSRRSAATTPTATTSPAPGRARPS